LDRNKLMGGGVGGGSVSKRSARKGRRGHVGKREIKGHFLRSQYKTILQKKMKLFILEPKANRGKKSLMNNFAIGKK